MEKKLWENPTMTELGVESTESGHNPTEEHDMTTYDNSEIGGLEECLNI